ncbi:MAG: DUF4358 domain-containing protein [Lachnospiraceae bacterium]|nr:DUF4358 domain-containing protein [Lachnospiraceae bacterium]
MKKFNPLKKTTFIITTVLSVTMLALSITGCKKDSATDSKTGDATESTTKAPENLDLEAVYQAILAAQGENSSLVLFPETKDSEYLAQLYPGLSNIESKQQVAYIAPITGFATEIILVEVTNSADLATLKNIFQSRIEVASSDVTYPETAALWRKNAQIQTAGNYIGMIVLSDEYIIPENVFYLDTNN